MNLVKLSQRSRRKWRADRQRRTEEPHRRRGQHPHLLLSWGREIEAPQTRVRGSRPRLLLPSWGERDMIALMKRMRSPPKGAPSPEAGRERSLPGGTKDPMKGLEGRAEKKDQKKGAPEEKGAEKKDQKK